MLNVFVGMGRLGGDSEIRITGKNEPIASFSIAIPQYNNDDVSWVNVVAFGKTADFVEKYFKSGMRVVVRGRLETGVYEKKDKNGNLYNVQFARIIADGVDFADGKTDAKPEKKKEQSEKFMSVPDNDEELPFK